MTVGVRNWPRKPLSERERTIREALSRFGETEDRHCIFVPAGGGLQAALSDRGTLGGILCLEPGTYTGDITITATAGVNCMILGAGMNSTVLTGSVSIQTGNIRMEDLWVMGTGKSYGIKCFKSGGDSPRNYFSKVRVGATSSGSGDGCTNGIYLDGAILNHFDQCQVSFCTASGLYVDTSVATYSTNVNTFYDCSFNGNGSGGTGYGVELAQGSGPAGGMMLNRFIGGNMENNVSGEAYIDTNTGVILSGVDFERDENVSGPISSPGASVVITSCNPVLMEDCNFVIGDTAGGGVVTTALAFHIIGCAAPVVRRNRFDGYPAGVIGVINEACIHAVSENNWYTAVGRVIQNRGNMRGFLA